jgi:hypothetical protein
VKEFPGIKKAVITEDKGKVGGISGGFIKINSVLYKLLEVIFRECSHCLNMWM